MQGCKTVGRRPSNPRKIVPTSRRADVGREAEPDYIFVHGSSGQDLLRDLGHNLKQARIHRGMTLEQAGEELGMSASSLSRIEGGKSEPKYLTLMAMCSLYRVDPMTTLLVLRGADEDGLLRAYRQLGEGCRDVTLVFMRALLKGIVAEQVMKQQ